MLQSGYGSCPLSVSGYTVLYSSLWKEEWEAEYYSSWMSFVKDVIQQKGILRITKLLYLAIVNIEQPFDKAPHKR